MAKKQRTARVEIVAFDLRQLRDDLNYTLEGLELPTRLRQIENWEFTAINARRFAAALAHAWQVAEEASRNAQSELEKQHYHNLRSKLSALSDMVDWIARPDFEKMWKANGLGK